MINGRANRGVHDSAFRAPCAQERTNNTLDLVESSNRKW